MVVDFDLEVLGVGEGDLGGVPDVLAEATDGLIYADLGGLTLVDGGGAAGDADEELASDEGDEAEDAEDEHEFEEGEGAGVVVQVFVLMGAGWKTCTTIFRVSSGG